MPKRTAKPGDECTSCFRILTQWSFDERYRRQRANALNSKLKSIRNGTAGHGRPKIRDDKQIAALRKQGLSMRAIASEIGLSTTAVQRSLKTRKAEHE